jgi:hypothetical protein
MFILTKGISVKKILRLLLASSSIFSMQLALKEKKEIVLHHVLNNHEKIHIKPSSVFVPEKLGSIDLYHGKNGFYIRQNDEKHLIQKCFTDPMIRNMTPKQLKAFQEVGRFEINQMNDGELSLKAKGRVVGGGPVFGTFMYGLTKTVCWGVIAAASIYAISQGGKATIGKVSPDKNDMMRTILENDKATNIVQDTVNNCVYASVGSLAAKAFIPVKTTAEVVAFGAGANAVATTGSATLFGLAGPSVVTTNGITIVSSKILASGYGPEAVYATAMGSSAVSSSGTGLGIAASIEALSIKVGLFFGMTPTP